MGTGTQPFGDQPTHPRSRESTDPSDDDGPDLTGLTVEGRYKVAAPLGRGGMGTVYRAQQLALDREVALKIIKPEFARSKPYLDRFLREAKISSRIQHPNVVQVLDFGQLPQGALYFVMELLTGQTLGQLLRERKRLPWVDAREILRQVVRGLGEAHRQGAVHRDIKPGNVFLVQSAEPGWRVKVLDFGIAKVVEQGRDDGLTSTNEVLGTAAYMAPEQAYARTVDARTDVYAVGVLAFLMLTGQLPFRGTSAFEVLTLHVSSPPPSMREIEPSITAAVEGVVFKALAKRPEDRFASMDELEAAITAAWDDEPAPAPPRRSTLVLVAGIVAAMGLASAATWALTRGPEPAATVAAAREPVAAPAAEQTPPSPDPEAPEEPSAAPAPPPDDPPEEVPPPEGEAPPPDAAPDDPAPETAARRKTSAGKRPRPTAKPKPAGPTSDNAVERALAGTIKKRCADKANGTRLEIRFSIVSSGRTSVPRALPPHRGTALGKCAERIVAGASFPPGALRAGRVTVDF